LREPQAAHGFQSQDFTKGEWCWLVHRRSVVNS
jgi:hypothetical protein